MKTTSFRSAALCLLLLSTALTAPLRANDTPEQPKTEQTEAVPAEKAENLPWLYQGSDIPVDESWKFGVLPNGLRYAVKNNGVPPGQVAIRIAVDVGSLHERDSELGYAHLLEHLLFRESKHVPDGEAKRIWQRYGASFGSDTNAQTSPTQTVYKLDLPQVTSANLDESMKILSGMVAFPKFTKTGVDAEKQIVMAEKRESDGPRMDMYLAANEHFYRGQRLATRPVIGTDDMLSKATPKSVGAFHARWYRPENVVISIAGDMPVEEMEALVVKHFGGWKVKGKAEAAPDFGDPVATGPDVKLIVDPTQPMMIVWSITKPWRPVKDTFAYNEQNMADDLALSIINRRLESSARKGGSFLGAGISNGKVSRSAQVTQLTILPADNDWQAALKDARAFVADAQTTPPSQADIDREVADYTNAITTMVDSYPFEAGTAAADSIVSAVDIRETVATPQVVQQFFTDAIPRFTPDRLFALTQTMFSGTTSRILVVSPVPIEGGEAAIEAAFKAPVAPDSAFRLDQKTIGFDALPALGAPGTVVSETEIGPEGLTRVEYANGVTALLFPNDGEVQKIKVRVRFGKGYQAFDPKKPNALWSGGMALVGSGVGDLGLEELDQLISGKRIGFDFTVDYDAFEFSADTRPGDLEGQLHLFAAKLLQPKWDGAPVERGKRQMLADYPSYSDSASSVLSRDMPQLMAGGDSRYLTPTPDDISALTPEEFRKTWEPILAAGPIEVMLFGDFDPETAVALVGKTFGALPARPVAKPVVGGADMGFAASNAGGEPVTRYHDGAANQAAAAIAWPTGAGLGDIREKRKLEILSDIYRDRLFETFRAAEGASYSPYAVTEWPENMESGGYFLVISQIQPANVGLFFDRANAIAVDLATTPVTEDELKRVVLPKMQWIDRASTGNAFWMNEMEGMTRDRPGRFRALRSLLSDYESITPAELQEAAARYLVPSASWRMQVFPRSMEGK